MAATLTFNPLLTTNVGAGAFNVTTDGYIQGFTLDNPSARQYLSGGFLISAKRSQCGAVSRWPNLSRNIPPGPRNTRFQHWGRHLRVLRR